MVFLFYIVAFSQIDCFATFFPDNLTSSKEYNCITSYLSSFDQSELPRETSNLLFSLNDFLKEYGYPSADLLKICTKLKMKFPTESLISEIQYEILSDSRIFLIMTIGNNDDVGSDYEPSSHLEKAVENYMWGVAEIAVGAAIAYRGDVVGGAFLAADGVRNCKDGWEELKEAIAEKEDRDD